MYGHSESATEHEANVSNLEGFVALVDYRDLDSRFRKPQFAGGGTLLRCSHYADFRTE